MYKIIIAKSISSTSPFSKNILSTSPFSKNPFQFIIRWTEEVSNGCFETEQEAINYIYDYNKNNLENYLIPEERCIITN